MAGVFQKFEMISKQFNAIEKRLDEHDTVIKEIRADNHNSFDVLTTKLNKLTEWTDKRFQIWKRIGSLGGEPLIATLTTYRMKGALKVMPDQYFSNPTLML